MKKYIRIIVLLVTAATLLSSCAGKYAPFPVSDEEKRVVATVKDFEILYDELRCAVLIAKDLMTEESGVNWTSPTDAEKYKDALYERVMNGLKYNYAVLALFKESGYTIENDKITGSVQANIEELIDECGGRSAYSKYLAENHLTDRVLRQTIAVNLAFNELVYSLCDSGAFDDYIDFDIEAISWGTILFSLEDYSKAMDFVYNGSNVVRTAHYILPADISDADLNSFLERASSADDFSKLEHGDDIAYEDFYQVKGERDPSYSEIAFSLEVGEISVCESFGRKYIIKRLDTDPDYLNKNYYDLIFRFLMIKTNEHISEYEKTFEVSLNELGKSIDFVALK